MTDMVEKVARAICNAEGIPDDERVTSSGREAWEYKVGRARAAIEAMMEPTDKMLEAVMPSIQDKECYWNDWQAMLKAALEDHQR